MQSAQYREDNNLRLLGKLGVLEEAGLTHDATIREAASQRREERHTTQCPGEAGAEGLLERPIVQY